MAPLPFSGRGGILPWCKDRRKGEQMAELKIMRAEQVPASPVRHEGAPGVTIRWLISKQDGAPNFAMRLFEVAPGGHSPLHRHEWEHEVYIVEGEGELDWEGERRTFTGGDFIFVAPGMEHRFRNTGSIPLKFLCMVPNDSY
jgi:quercetin dioxygenase-like cupin family protein